MTAAVDVGPASRPLLLFYALEQVGQAVVAARLEREVRGTHGLKICQPSYALELHEVTVEPNGKGLFQAIAEAIATEAPELPMKLGELWASLPEGANSQFPGADYPHALVLHPEDRPGPTLTLRFTATASAWVYAFPPALTAAPPEAQADWLHEYLRHYPSAVGWQSPNPDGVAIMNDPAAGSGVRLQWPLPTASGSASERFEYLLSVVAPRYDHYMHGWIRPAVGGSKPLPPLLTWWSLLYALSMFARYKPGRWTALLDVDRSANAVLIESILDEALTAVPRLCLEALTGHAQLGYG